MDFERHVARAEENVRNQGVDFPTATHVFLDPHEIEREDTRTSYSESQLEVIGMVGAQVLVVIETPRADWMRLISAPKANQCERGAYDTGEAAS